MKKIEKENNRPAANLPYQDINRPFRCQYIIPMDESIVIMQDANGVCYLGAKGGSLDNLVAGDNILLTKRDDGKIIISSVDTATDIAAGQNITIDIDPETGTAIINSITGGATNEHYQGVFDTAEDLIAFDTDPEIGDYGMIKNVTYSDGGETTWNGQYKYCFYINGQWTVVDQMLTFTDDIELLQQFYSVGGSSPVIYLHKIAQTGSFNDLRDVPIVETPVLTVEGDTVTATCATEGAEIWYTTDGTMPHVNGIRYTGPVTVAGATTFRFVGIKNGMINSLEATVGVDYQLQPPTIDLDWHDGTITMANPNQSGTIYYSTDGSTPTNASNAYTGPFIIDEATLFKLVVIDGNNQSSVTEQQYMQAHPVTNFSIVKNYIIGRASIRFSNSEEGEAHYEMYDSIPTYNSPLSQGSITFPYYDHENPRYYSVRVFNEGKVPSIVKISPQNGKQKPTAPEISFDPETGLVSINRISETVSIQLIADLLTSGCTIRYTIDGSTPTAESLVYNGPFQISENVTVKAVLIAFGQYYSDVAIEEISIVAAPVVTLDSEVGDISITGPAGATIYYTRDGSTPTPGSTRYTMPINVMNSAHEEIRAIAVLNGSSSAVTVAEFQGLSWRDNGSVNVNYTSGVVTITPKIAADGATISYGIGSNGGYPVSYYVYRNPVTLQLFDTDGKRVFFKQQKYGYIPNIYEADFTTQVSVDVPEIIYDENTGKATIALDGNTADIPLYSTTDLPSLGARIYYTTDGTTPSADNGTLYDGVSEIPVSVGETLKATTVCYSEYDSEVNDWARTPKISVDSMTGLMTIVNPYGSQTRYTLDGSTPTQYSTLYSEPVDVSVYTGIGRQYLTIKAAAFENNVAIAVSELTMPVVAIEQISMISAGPGEDDRIDISASVSGVDDVSIFTSKWFRTGGGLPDASGLIETWIEAGTNIYYCEVFDTISAFGHSTQVRYLTRFYQDGHIPVNSAPILIGFDTPDAPSVNYNDTAMTATFARTGNTAYIPLNTDTANPEQGCRIYYTLDGSTPTDQSTLWNGNAVQCQAGDLIKAICICYGQYASEVTTEEITPEPSLNYMYLEAVQAGSTVSMNSKLETAPDLEYSTDGETWQEWQHTTANGAHTFDTLTLTAVGDKVYFRGDNPSGLGAGSFYSNFVLSGRLAGGGDVMSLLSKDMSLTEVPFTGFIYLFSGAEALTSAPSIGATSIGDYGCNGMYIGCTSLVTAADMPNVTNIGNNGCADMYSECPSLVTAADMPNVTNIGNNGCREMYYACPSLVTAADMPNVTNIGNDGCLNMYIDCTFMMSNDGGQTLSFGFPSLPITAGNTTYSTPLEVGQWMGNTNGLINP